jgi:hypothetical protein
LEGRVSNIERLLTKHKKQHQNDVVAKMAWEYQGGAGNLFHVEIWCHKDHFIITLAFSLMQESYIALHLSV